MKITDIVYSVLKIVTLTLLITAVVNRMKYALIIKEPIATLQTENSKVKNVII
jgi:hypothetical protein